MLLTGLDLLEWIALRRVHEGGVALHGSQYLHWGQKVPCYLPEVFDRLVETGLTEALEPGCSSGLCRVVPTFRGHDRYQELTAKRGLSPDPEQSSGGCSVAPDPPLSRDGGRSGAPAGRWLSQPPLGLPTTGRSSEGAIQRYGRI
ncbi:MAG: hypothetical protein ACRDTG_10215 [Pseudonocardiaceae bacterium]